MKETKYWCLTGHVITERQLDQSTELLTLDDGAVVRVCTEHGAPLSVSVRESDNPETNS
jgi:hypothetical protein